MWSSRRHIEEPAPRITIRAVPVQCLDEGVQRIVPAASLVTGGIADTEPGRRYERIMGSASWPTRRGTRAPPAATLQDRESSWLLIFSHLLGCYQNCPGLPVDPGQGRRRFASLARRRSIAASKSGTIWNASDLTRRGSGSSQSTISGPNSCSQISPGHDTRSLMCAGKRHKGRLYRPGNLTRQVAYMLTLQVYGYSVGIMRVARLGYEHRRQRCTRQGTRLHRINFISVERLTCHRNLDAAR